MFGLFKNTVKLLNLVGRKTQVNAKLSNGAVIPFSIAETDVDEFVDLLIEKGLNSDEVKSAESMYHKFIHAFNPGGETYTRVTGITSESLLNDKMTEIEEIVSGFGSKSKPVTVEEKVVESSVTTVKEKIDEIIIDSIIGHITNSAHRNDSSSQVSNATNGMEPPRGLVSVKVSKDGIIKQVVPEEEILEQEKPVITEETVVAEEKIELATVVSSPTIQINNEAIHQITKIIESDVLDIIRISDVLMKAGEAGVSKEGFTFKLSDVEGDVIIEKDGVEGWDITLETPEEKQRILDILKDIE